MDSLITFFKRHQKAWNFGAIFLLSVGISFNFFKPEVKEVFISPLSEPTELREPAYAIANDKTEIPTPDPNKNTLGVLLLGYGGAGHQGGFLADVIMIAFFDFDRNNLSFVSIPRDTWYEGYKVNSLLSVKDKALETSRIKTAVSKITGLPLQYVLAVDFVGFQRLIGENFKGIKVDVPETFQDDWYPIRGEEVNPCGKSSEEITTLTNTLSGFELEKQFPCRYEKIYFPKGENTMHGGEALKYVRSRHSSSDFARSERQKVILLGLRDKIFSAGFVKDAAAFFKNATKNISTDLDLKSLEIILPNLQKTPALAVKNITLSTENVFQSSKGPQGQFILSPKESWDAVRAYVDANRK